MLDFLLVFLGLIVVSGLIYGLATFVFGRGEEQAPMPPDVAPLVLPEGRRLTAADLRGVRLPVSVRGYRMSDVDELLDRLAEELDRRSASAVMPAVMPAGADEDDVERTGPTEAVEADAPVELPVDREADQATGADEVERPRSAP